MTAFEQQIQRFAIPVALFLTLLLAATHYAAYKHGRRAMYAEITEAMGAPGAMLQVIIPVKQVHICLDCHQ